MGACSSEEKLAHSTTTKWLLSNRTPNLDEQWVDVTRRETIEGAEQAIDSSVEHYAKKLEYLKGPKVVKTFE